jgi:hypothetical protein
MLKLILAAVLLAGAETIVVVAGRTVALHAFI